MGRGMGDALSGARVLILGGTGFMGSRAVAALAAAGHEVTVLSRRGRTGNGAIESIAADRQDRSALARALEGRRFDFTVDFCAFDASDVEDLLLVPYAALGRYVMISTGQVYLVTQAPRMPYREEDSAWPLKEEPPAGGAELGQWSYGAGKRRAESTLLALRGSHGVRAVSLRLPIIQGEGDPSLRLWAWIERMLDGGPILLPGGGASPVRFLYAGDVARTLRDLLEAPPREPVYNLAQPEIVPLRDFLERVARAAGLAPRFVEVDPEEAIEAGLPASFAPFQGPWTSILDPARAAAEWGFSGTRLDDYLPAVVRWHLEHRPSQSHRGYERRDREIELAEALARPALTGRKRDR